MKKNVINKRYRIIDKLGEGAMGAVYLAEDSLYSMRQVALKTIHKYMLNRKVIKQFRQEFEIMSRLKHPNLTGVYNFDQNQADLSYFISMEYVKGVNLQDWLSANTLIDIQTKLSVFVSLLRAIEFIHSRNIIHCDLKPANILINPADNEVKVADFGLAAFRAVHKVRPRAH